MSAGKLLRWQKKVGDRVQRGDIIADVETDKADIEIEVFVTGVIDKFLAQPGDRVPVGTGLAIIQEEGKPTPTEAPPISAVRPSVSGPTIPEVPGPAIPAPVSRVQIKPSRIHISPAAKKLAADLRIAPASVAGTGPEGRITMDNVQRAARAQGAQPTHEVALDRPAGPDAPGYRRCNDSLQA